MSTVAERWNRYWFSEASLVRLGVFRVLILIITAYSLRYPTHYIMKYAGRTAEDLPGIWNPLYFVQALGIGPLSRESAHAILVVLAIAIALALVGLFTRPAMLVVAALSLFWWGMGYSFDQAHHEKISLAFAIAALAVSPCGARFSIDATIKRLRGVTLPETSPFAAWPIRLIQVSVAVTYFFAGASKLAISGLEWLNGYSLQAVVRFDSVFTTAIHNSLLFAQLASIWLLLVQITFPLIFLDKRLRWLFVPASVAFHLGAWMTMVNGPYYTLWLVTIVAFFRVETIPATLRAGWLAGERVRVAAQTTLLLAFVALCVAILNIRYPWWTPTLLVGVLALMTWLLLRPEAGVEPSREIAAAG